MGRTPPGVRELKQAVKASRSNKRSRTPPGVRELKHFLGLILPRDL